MAYVDGQLIKGSGPEIYVIQGGQRRWIPDPRTFNDLGYNWNAVITVTDNDLKAIPLGPQIQDVTMYVFPAPWDTIASPGNSIYNFNGSLWGRFLSKGGGHTVLGKCEMDLTTGHMNGELLVANGVFFLGYHGGITGICIDANGMVIGNTPVFKVGVDAAWGTNRWSAETPWSFDFPADVASKTRGVRVFVTDVPEDLQYILDHDVHPAETELANLIPLVQKIAAIFSGSPSTNTKTNPLVAAPAANPAPIVMPRPINLINPAAEPAKAADAAEGPAGDGHKAPQPEPA